MVWGSAQYNAYTWMMLRFEQSEELQIGDMFHLQERIAEIGLCQFLNYLDHASTRRDGTTWEVGLVDQTVWKELDTIDRFTSTLFRRCG